MILFIDNYDSFVHNLARYVENLGHDTRIVRNNKISVDDVSYLNPEAVIISPGPCGPLEAGVSVDIVKYLGDSIPVLGVCLGHQCIAKAYGSLVVRAKQPMHGKAVSVRHGNSKLFSGVPSPFQAGLYHSLMTELDDFGPLVRTAESDGGVIMAIEHEEHPVYGVQFHPESILTEHGGTIIENFMSLAFQWNEMKRAA